MKKSFCLLMCLSLLLLGGCRPTDAPLAFFEREAHFTADFSFEELEASGDCRFFPDGSGSITLLSPPSLEGITLRRRGDTVTFSHRGVEVVIRDTRFFDFWSAGKATPTQRSEVGKETHLTVENEKGRFIIRLSADGCLLSIEGEAGTLTVTEILP